MFSVTSDLAASLSVQTAPQRPARPDPSQSNDSFSALVGSTATNVDSDPLPSSAPSPAPDRPAPQRPADDASAHTDNGPSRSGAATDQAPPRITPAVSAPIRPPLPIAPSIPMRAPTRRRRRNPPPIPTANPAPPKLGPRNHPERTLLRPIRPPRRRKTAQPW